MASKTESLSAMPVQPSGWQYAVRILIGCVIVWFVLQRMHHPNPLWALISVIIVTEPELSAAFLAFNSRIVNTLIGCAVGLSFLYLLGPSYWSILLGIVVSVILCTHCRHSHDSQRTRRRARYGPRCGHRPHRRGFAGKRRRPAYYLRRFSLPAAHPSYCFMTHLRSRRKCLSA